MTSFIFEVDVPPDLTTVNIRGDRIILRSLHETYAPDIFAEFNAEITRYMFPKPAEAVEDTLAFISQSVEAMREKRELVLTITDLEGKFLGCCGLHSTDNPRIPEFGIWLKKSAHGNRYGQEAIALLAVWTVNNLEFDFVIYPVDRANIASRKIPESLGGFVYVEKKVTSLGGRVLDEVVYKLPRDVLSNRIKPHHSNQ